MKFEITDLNKIDSIQKRVENNSVTIDDIVAEIINPYCKDLDRYVAFISDCLKDGETPPTDNELDDFCLNLSTYIYFAGGMCEQLGIRDDISKAVYKETYNSKRSELDYGTVADKDSLAELASQSEAIVSMAYTRAYKTLKGKLENAQELLSSCKKVLSHRMQEQELTRIGG